MKALNVTKSTVVAANLEEASNFISRLKGLIGRARLGQDEGLWMARCRAIHTFWMRFPIDVVFLDEELVVKKVVKSLQPYHPFIFCRSAKGVLELHEGTIEKASIGIGDTIEIKQG